MQEDELKSIAQTIFSAAVKDAWNEGETVMEDGRDQYHLETMNTEELLRASASYFESVL
jgi:hypothetical protein